MTLTFNLDLESIEMNQDTKYLGQRSFNSEVIIQTHTQTDKYTQLIVQPGPVKWSWVKIRTVWN